MKKLHINIILIVCIILFTCISLKYSIIETFSKKSITLTFDTTQKLDKEYIKKINSLSKDTKKKIINILDINDHTLYQYPNVLKNVQADIADLLQKKNLRTKKRIQEIYKDVTQKGLLGQFNITDTNTKHKILDILFKIDPIILYIKQHFNRVRPSFINKDIQPVIKIPDHPSYPSGHAIQAFIISHILPKKNFKKNVKIAERIALNREIAGVHYKSDTDYSRILAPKIFNLYKDLYKK